MKKPDKNLERLLDKFKANIGLRIANEPAVAEAFDDCLLLMRVSIYRNHLYRKLGFDRDFYTDEQLEKFGAQYKICNEILHCMGAK